MGSAGAAVGGVFWGSGVAGVFADADYERSHGVPANPDRRAKRDQ